MKRTTSFVYAVPVLYHLLGDHPENVREPASFTRRDIEKAEGQDIMREV